MMRSTGSRFLIVALLALLMYVPLFFVSAVVQDRADLSRDTIREVGGEWGGPQLISGPVLILPVEGPVTMTEIVDVADPETGEIRQETRQITEIRRRAPIFVLPGRFDLALQSESFLRARGIFEVPVYSASARMEFDFDLAPVDAQVMAEERILWDEAQVRITVTQNRALRGATRLAAGDRDLPLEPRADGEAGITASIGDPRELSEFALTLGFNGASEIQVTPMGRISTIRLSGDWPDPSFFGAFLPDSHEVSEAGFTANWTIPHLARPLPQAARSDTDSRARQSSAFGVRFFQPNDFYQKAYRAARYGILFIALTFLTVVLVEGRSAKPAHPVQYILIGLAQSVFVLLMVSYSEQIGFGPAYALSAGATTALLTLFGALGLKLGRRTWVLGTTLVVTYAVLYLILRSADYALLVGSTLAFFALALTMYATRNEDWYGPETGAAPRPWFGKARKTDSDDNAPLGSSSG